MVVVRRTRRKGSAKRDSTAISRAAESYRKSVDDLEEFKREAADVLARLGELEEARTHAQVQLEAEAFKYLRKGQKPAEFSGLKLYKKTKKGRRKVDAKALLSKHPTVWTHDGLVSISVAGFEKLIASGVVDSGDADDFVIPGTDSEEVHIEVQEEDTNG